MRPSESDPHRQPEPVSGAAPAAVAADALPPVAETVDVAVPVPVRSTFTYRVPPALARRVRVGSRVLVPFGSRLLTGYVVIYYF